MKPSFTKESLITTIHKLGINERDIIIHTLSLGYNSVSYNPLNHIYFYKNDDPYSKFTLPIEKIKRLLPNEIEEVMMRVFIKNSYLYQDSVLEQLKKTLNYLE